MPTTRVSSPGIADASVTTAKVADASITTSKIAPNAITTDRIALGAVVTDDLADSSVTTQKISDGSITDAKITTAGLASSSINWQAIQPWAANTAYAKGALVEYQGIAYRRSVAGSSTSTFVSTNWQQITPTTIPNTIVTGLGTMATATASDYLARAGGTMTGQLVTTAGTASAPGVAVSGDTNTGIAQLGGADTLGVVTGGVERWRVGSDGATQSVIPGGSTLLPQFMCRAWVNFDGTRDTTGTASTANTNRLIRGSGNVSSVLRNGAGDYTINFTTAMPDANYCVSALAGSVGVAGMNATDIGGTGGAASNHSTASVRLFCYQQATTTPTDPTSFNVAIFR